MHQDCFVMMHPLFLIYNNVYNHTYQKGYDNTWCILLIISLYLSNYLLFSVVLIINPQIILIFPHAISYNSCNFAFTI